MAFATPLQRREQYLRGWPICGPLAAGNSAAANNAGEDRRRLPLTLRPAVLPFAARTGFPGRQCGATTDASAHQTDLVSQIRSTGKSWKGIGRAGISLTALVIDITISSAAKVASAVSIA